MIRKPVLQMVFACLCVVATGCVLATPTESLPIKVRETLSLSTPGPAVAVAWSADGSRLVAASDYGLYLSVWDRDGHLIKRIWRAGGGPTLWGSIAFVNGSSELVFLPPATAGGNASFSVWDVETGKIAKTENGPQPGGGNQQNRAEHFMVSPDQEILAVATGAVLNYTKNVTAYDLRSWRMMYAVGVHPHISSLCIFDHGRLLGLGSITSGLITVLNAKTGVRVNRLSGFNTSPYGSFSLGAIAGSPDGKLILAGITQVILNGQYVNTQVQRSWDDSIESNAVKIFRVNNGSLLASFSYAQPPIRQAAWDPEGRYVAFIDNHSGLFLWAPWHDLGYKRIEVPGLELSLAVSPDGREIAVTTDVGISVYSISWSKHKP